MAIDAISEGQALIAPPLLQPGMGDTAMEGDMAMEVTTLLKVSARSPSDTHRGQGLWPPTPQMWFQNSSHRS